MPLVTFFVKVAVACRQLPTTLHQTARCSDNPFLVAVFEISEADGKNVEDPLKLQYIQSMLNVHVEEEKIPNKSGMYCALIILLAWLREFAVPFIWLKSHFIF